MKISEVRKWLGLSSFKIKLIEKKINCFEAETDPNEAI